MKRLLAAMLSRRLLERQRDELIGELRQVSPGLTEELEETLAALREQVREKG